MAPLVEEMKTLADHILSSANERKEAIGRIRSEAKEFLATCDAEQRSMAEQLRNKLTNGETERLDGFREMHDSIVGRVADIASQAREFLATCDEEHRSMAEQLRNKLTNGETARLDEFREMHGRIAGRVTELRQGVTSMLGDLRDDFRAASKVWSDLARARAGMPTSQEIAAQEAQASAAEDRKHQAEDERKAKEKAEKAVWDKMSDEEKVLKIVCDNPGGVSASEIGQWLGTTAQQAGRIATQLAENPDMSVRKDEGTRLYHPSE